MRAHYLRRLAHIENSQHSVTIMFTASREIEVNKSNETAKDSAVSNAILSIKEDKWFPERVLAGDWEDYLFFQPFMMFVPGFIDVTKLLLTEETASVIALINLGNVIPTNYENPPVIFIEKSTGAREYISELEGKGVPLSWRVLMDRYVCASDKGNWCLYCEKENDVGVFGCRKGFSQPLCLRIERLLKAKSIRSASDIGDTQRFDFGKLLPAWKKTLIVEHQVKSAGDLS